MTEPRKQAAVRIDANDCAMATWDDPSKGTIRWQTLLSKGLTATSGMVCGIAHLAPGETFALHHHAEAEIYFGIEGAGQVMIDGVGHDLAPGVALFIPTHAVHGIPACQTALRFFYVFAADSFDEIAYQFV